MNLKRWRFDVLGELDALRRYARALTRNPSDAEDLVHDTLLRAHVRRATFRRDGNLRVWLLAVMHSAFVDGVRQRKGEAARLKRAWDLAVADAPAPQEHTVRLAQVRRAFFELPEEQRAALHLVAIEGLTYDDAATALGIPAGTLMSRVSRARDALRAIEDATPDSNNRFRIIGGGHER